jgi:hypothetical protein
MYSFLERMLISKYLYPLLFIIESKYAYHTATSIQFYRKSNIHNRNMERKADIIKNSCGYINNATEYIFELCAIIDIMLPKK